MNAEKQMDDSEQLAKEYLLHQGLKDEDIVYEPNGRDTAPDFLVGGRVRVEVRRLNQTQQKPSGRNRGLEEDAIPLQGKMLSFLKSLGPPASSGSWFVSYSFRRPLARWGNLGPVLKRELVAFRECKSPRPAKIKITKTFELDIFPATNAHPHFFVLAGFLDKDSGGWVLHEVGENLKVCIEEKTRKLSGVLPMYEEWWLIFVDHIGCGLYDDFDREQLRTQVRIAYNWNKVILLDSADCRRASEIWTL